MWVTCKPVDVEMHGNNRVKMYVFEIRIGVNEFAHCISAMHLHHTGQGSNPHSGLSRCCLSRAKMP